MITKRQLERANALAACMATKTRLWLERKNSLCPFLDQTGKAPALEPHGREILSGVYTE
jgi:hypothetical protein